MLKIIPNSFTPEYLKEVDRFSVKNNCQTGVKEGNIRVSVDSYRNPDSKTHDLYMSCMTARAHRVHLKHSGQEYLTNAVKK